MILTVLKQISKVKKKVRYDMRDMIWARVLTGSSKHVYTFCLWTLSEEFLDTQRYNDKRTEETKSQPN